VRNTSACLFSSALLLPQSNSERKTVGQSSSTGCLLFPDDEQARCSATAVKFVHNQDMLMAIDEPYCLLLETRLQR